MAMLVVQVSVDGIFYQVNFILENMTCIGWSDVNECLRNNGGCDGKRTCTNTAGGRICGNCPSGFVNVGATDCAGQCRPNILSCEFCFIRIQHVLIVQT